VNDIASVEFEAHTPLFFDPYTRNRATGSFILIDPISNATVGAGMIQEFPADQQIQEEREIVFPEIAENPVRAEERYRRQGHRPATFLLPNQPGLATRLERALFDQGFEVLHLDAAASLETPVEMLRATYALGAISIYSGDALDPGVTERPFTEATAALFDLSAEIENASEEEILRRALALADSLRIANSQNHQDEVN
jgi:hypothetical protein